MKFSIKKDVYGTVRLLTSLSYSTPTDIYLLSESVHREGSDGGWGSSGSSRSSSARWVLLSYVLSARKLLRQPHPAEQASTATAATCSTSYNPDDDGAPGTEPHGEKKDTSSVHQACSAAAGQDITRGCITRYSSSVEIQRGASCTIDHQLVIVRLCGFHSLQQD